MPITEIESAGDAKVRLARFFGNDLPHLDEYAKFVSLLADDKFPDYLENLSSVLWDAYNMPGTAQGSNRFTRAILFVASELGFSHGTYVVLTAPAEPAAFGERIRTGHLWKDSFALGHGEFAHSYQWLAGGLALSWKKDTVRFYSDTAGKKSKVPMFVRDPGGIAVRSAFLWEWLVDCTHYQSAFDKEVAGAVDSWISTQLEKWCANQPAHSCFVTSFFSGQDPDIKPIMELKEYKEVYLPRRGKDAKALQAEIVQKYGKQIAGYAADLVRLYPVRNALSEKSYRNANNITDLVRNRKDWFIATYENHRYDSLYRKQNAVLLERAAEKLTDVLVESGLEINSNEEFLRAIRATMIRLGMNLDLSDFEFFKKLRESYWAIVNSDKFGNAGKKKQKDESLGIFRGSIQPIQALKRERQHHYHMDPNTAGWQPAKDDKTIFEKDTTRFVNKNAKNAVFHKKPGTLNERPAKYAPEGTLL